MAAPGAMAMPDMGSVARVGAGEAPLLMSMVGMLGAGAGPERAEGGREGLDVAIPAIGPADG